MKGFSRHLRQPSPSMKPNSDDDHLQLDLRVRPLPPAIAASFRHPKSALSSIKGSHKNINYLSMELILVHPCYDFLSY
ncbi:hypothetical protein P8452_55074 [Trifolium repens]|nr:hypothetical protein P8452_55074 [Trifolium repens]